MKNKSRNSKTQRAKKKWVNPKLEILSEKTYEEKPLSKIYAQYTGGGGSGYHNPGGPGMGHASIYNDCM